MTLTKSLTIAACAAAFATPAFAQMDYHGFDPQVVDEINDQLDGALTGERLAALSPSRSILACRESGNDVGYDAPEGWEARYQAASSAGDNAYVPVPTTALSPAYPPVMSLLNVEGSCNVIFDVDAGGDPENIIASCTMAPFRDTTVEAIEALSFEAGSDRATPEAANILVPINYCLSEAETEGEG